MIIIIPTKDRPEELNNTIKFLDLNRFFFKKIIIVDSSTLKKKKIINKIIKNYNLNIKIINSKPSTCIQRNIGFQFIKDEKYVMFLDDDNIFYADAFYRMKEFLNNHNDFVGVAFNQIHRDKEGILEKFKKNIILDYLGIYSAKKGGVSRSGWQSRFINFKKNVCVEWLPTRAVIYKSSAIKNIRFDENLGIYGYLEDLDFSLELKKKGNLMVCGRAKYRHDQVINRLGYEFGKKEIKNRYYIVKKHNLSKILFFLNSLLRAIITLKDFIFGDINSIKRLIGNFSGLTNINKLKKN
jgi:hypothetical protein